MTPPKYYSEELLDEIFDAFGNNSEKKIGQLYQAIEQLKNLKIEEKSEASNAIQELETQMQNSEVLHKRFEQMEK